MKRRIQANGHYLALAAWTLSWLLAVLGGSLYAHIEHVSEGLGIYWAITTVETVGYGDVAPTTAMGHWVAATTMLLAIPMWTISFGLVQSWIMSLHADEVKSHITGKFDEHLPKS